MFQNFFIKIIGIVSGIISIILPFGQVRYVSNEKVPVPVSPQAISTQVNVETGTTSKANLSQEISTQATSTKKLSTQNQKPSQIQSNKTVTTTATPVEVQTQQVATTKTKSTISFDQINDFARKALVNILCTTKSAGPFSPISGSGVVISSDGVIVTNAHVVEYYLLKDFNGQKDFVQCLIRTGSPAYPSYIAELVYIPPIWVQDNSKILVEQNPTGTGEHDYAFLKIISKTDGSSIQSRLPYMPISLDENINKGNNILLASYPAGFLGGIAIEKDLYQTSTITQIFQTFTFSENTVDVISVPGTVVSQKGSSGGAAVNDQDELAGIITTSSDASTTGGRDLRAITLPYINRDLIANAGINLQTILENSQSISDTFNQTIADSLTKILTDSILVK